MPFLSKALRHHNANDPDTMERRNVPTVIRNLYQLLLDAAYSSQEPDAGRIQQISSQYMEAVSLLNPWAELSTQLHERLIKHGEAYQNLHQEMARIRAGLARAEKLADERLESITRENEALSDAQRIVHEQIMRISVLESALGDAQHYVRQREADISEQHNDLNQLGEKINELQAEINRIQRHWIWPLVAKLIGKQ